MSLAAVSLLAACGGGHRSSVTPGAIAVPSAEQADCSGGDRPWCDAARELADRATTEDIGFFTNRLLLEEQSCAGQASPPESCVGAHPTGSVPAIPFVVFGTDCCYVSGSTFAMRLRDALGQLAADTSSRVEWRPYGILRRSPFWHGDVAIVIRSIAPFAGGIVEFGVRRMNDDVQILGARAGRAAGLTLSPGEEFREVQ